MDQTPADLEREIAEIRADTELIIDELERRGRRLLDIRRAAEKHPATAVVLVTGLVLLVALGAFGLLRRLQPPPAPENLVDRFVHWLRDQKPIAVTRTTKEAQRYRWRRQIASTLLRRTSSMVVGATTAVVSRLVTNALLPKVRPR